MNNLTTRQQAIKWWSDLSDTQKYKLDRDTSHLRPGRGISWQNFTGREIEQIWLEENFELIYENQAPGEEAVWTPKTKPNQKQFVEFNEELFLKYINKFSDRDLVTAAQLLNNLRIQRKNNN